MNPPRTGDSGRAAPEPGEPALPVDSDVDDIVRSAPAARPLHLRGRYLLVVGVGGAIGTAAREGLSLAIPPIGSLPLAILLINLAGAFALGVVLEFLVRHGPDQGPRRLARLLIGTGFMGGFTTYSTLATGTATLLTGGHVAVGIGYALGTIVAGAGATFAGTTLSAAAHRAILRRHDGTIG